MQEAVIRAEAAESALGFQPGEIKRAVEGGKLSQQRELLDKQPTTKALLTVLANHGNQWDGPCADFLELIKAEAGPDGLRYIVQHPGSLTKWLRKNAPDLRTVYGIDCDREYRCRDDNRSRGYFIVRVPKNGTVQLPGDLPEQKPSTASDQVSIPDLGAAMLAAAARAAKEETTIN